MAAQAVERRLNPQKDGLSYSQKKIQMQAKKELEEEEKRLAEAFDRGLDLDAREEAADDGGLTLGTESSLLYTCDLLENVVLSKAEVSLPSPFTLVISGVIYKSLMHVQMLNAIEAYLVAQMSEEPVDASVLMIYSLNSRSAIDAAISTLTTILNNILKEPNNLKYRRIRMTNKTITVGALY